MVLNTSYADRLAPYLPTLNKLGMNAGSTMFAPGGYGNELKMDYTTKYPQRIAGSIFDFYKTAGHSHLFKGYTDKNAYMEVGLLYDPKDHALSIAVGEVAGSSPTWVAAWNQADEN